MPLPTFPVYTSTEFPLETPLPFAPPEQHSGADRAHLTKFKYLFRYKDFFEYPSVDNDGIATDELPNFVLNRRPASERKPVQICSLSSPLPPKNLKRFVNKDTILYVDCSHDKWSSGGGSLANDLFRAWYPLRPPAPTHTSVKLQDAGKATTLAHSQSEQASATPLSAESGSLSAVVETSSATGQPTKPLQTIPTTHQAYVHLEHGFCAPMALSPKRDPDFEVHLADLIPAHIALVDGLHAVLDQIKIEEIWLEGWSRGLARLSGGFRSGFCIHDGRLSVVDSGWRWPGDIPDTRARRSLRVVGREAWVRRGWGSTHADLDLWQEVAGVDSTASSEVDSEEGRWLTRTMGLQEAVEGVVRASGEEHRFEEKPVSDYFDTMFLNPPIRTEEDIKEMKAYQARFLGHDNGARPSKEQPKGQEETAGEPQNRSWYEYLRSLFGI